jgi:hypothetical protein
VIFGKNFTWRWKSSTPPIKSKVANIKNARKSVRDMHEGSLVAFQFTQRTIDFLKDPTIIIICERTADYFDCAKSAPI